MVGVIPCAECHIFAFGLFPYHHKFVGQCGVCGLAVDKIEPIDDCRGSNRGSTGHNDQVVIHTPQTVGHFCAVLFGQLPNFRARAFRKLVPLRTMVTRCVCNGEHAE